MWNGVVPLIGVIMFLQVLAWWAIEGVIAGVRYICDEYRAMAVRSPFV